MFNINSNLVLTNKRNNMNVHIAKIGSRTKMKRNDIRTLFICAVTHGHALRWQGTRQYFMSQRPEQNPIPVATVVRTFHDPGSPHRRLVAHQWRYLQSKIGRCELFIYKKCTNLASAITQKSFSEPIISDSTWSTVMLEQVENGQICLKTRVWKTSHCRSPLEPRRELVLGVVEWALLTRRMSIDSEKSCIVAGMNGREWYI